MQSEDNTVVCKLPPDIEQVHSTSVSPNQETQPICCCSSPISNCALPKGWQKSLPIADHAWVSDALFKTNAKTGKPEMAFSQVDKLWWHPPQVPLICSELPRPTLYFAQSLFLWMPRKLWRCRLTCTQANCRKDLTSAGVYKTVRQVLDVDSYYNLATEYLECISCRTKVAAWDSAILSQLDIGRRLQFPALVAYKHACDVRVIRPLRERTSGNSPTLLYKTLSEQHTERYYQKVLRYLTDCRNYKEAYDNGTQGSCPEFMQPPDFKPVHTAQWLQTAYLEDVFSRLDEMKSSITSTFGSIIRMDSNAKVTKKLGGEARDTAECAVNVGNEYGQILMSVLTCAEGDGLVDMAAGLMKRYSDARVSPPKVLYVKRGCCGNEHKHLRKLFENWPNLIVRLDVWHLMTQFTHGCTTKSHPLYDDFMDMLSDCFFLLSEEDWSLLKKAKRREMLAEFIPNPSEKDVIARITKEEKYLHCRRITRRPEIIKSLVYDLIKMFASPKGNDTHGVPFFDSSRIWKIWDTEQKHFQCVIDPKDLPLYTRTGTLKKGGVALPMYHCVRTASLDSFHTHLNGFIPGRCANPKHFQAYLLEGMFRWNKDCAANAVTCNSESRLRSYSWLLSKTVHSLGMETFGTELCPAPATIGLYTGELIGVEYLYSQSGNPLFPLLDENGQAILSNQEESQEMEDEGIGLTECVTVGDGDILTNDSVLVSLEDRSRSLSSDQVVSNDEPGDNEITSAQGSVRPDDIPGNEKASTSADSLPPLRDCSVSLSEGDVRKYMKQTGTEKDVPKRKQPSPTPNETTAPPQHTTPTQPPALEEEFVQILLSGTTSRSTLSYWKKRAAKEAAGLTCRPRYKPRTRLSVCSKCGEARTADSHKQFYGSWFCAATSTVSYEVWLAALKEKRNTKRRSRSETDVPKELVPIQPSSTTAETSRSCETNPATLPTTGMKQQLVFILPRGTPPTRPQIVSLPPTTQSCRKKRAGEEAAGLARRKKYKPRTGLSICSQCDKPRTADTHKQYYGNQYCAAASTVSHEVWLQGLKDKVYGKRAKK